MGNTAVAGVEPWGGRSRATILDHTGPTSYATGGETLGQSAFGGPNVLGLSGFYKVDGGLTVSGNYRVDALYGGTGPRAAIKLKWTYAGNNMGVDGVSSSGGSAMTAGTYALSFSGGGGTGAAGTVTVSTSAVTAITITSTGSGYTSIPTVSAATGGTPPTLTATIGVNIGGEVAPTTNLSGETVRLLAIGG